MVEPLIKRETRESHWGVGLSVFQRGRKPRNTLLWLGFESVMRDGRESQRLRGTGMPSHLERFSRFLSHPRINYFFGFLLYGSSLFKFDHNFCNHDFTKENVFDS